jgi:galactokinase
MIDKIVSQAPARVCLFGDHQDYLRLPIIATTINRNIEVSATRNNSRCFKIFKKDLGEYDDINIDDDIDQNETDFLKIAIRVLKDYSCIPDKGYDIIISSNIPINSGLSSSSALIVAWINFLLNTFSNHKVSAELLAEISYRIEVIEKGNSGGKMDQYTISFGKTIFLDTLNDKVISYDHNLCDMIIGVSNQPKNTEGLLKKLKTNALISIDLVKKKFPKFDIYNPLSFDLETCLLELDEEFRPYFRAAVGNYQITLNAQNEFNKSLLNIEKISKLMSDHHDFLKNDLKITTPEIDHMIDIAEQNGSLASKIVGSGGGGSIVCLSNNKETSIKIVKELNKIGVKEAFIAKRGSGPKILINE